MAYLLSNDTAQFVDKLKKSYSSVKKRRDFPLLNNVSGLDDVYVCRITGGNALLGYTARAYKTLEELRADELGTGGMHVMVFPLEIGLDGRLPAGSIVLSHVVPCRVTGGSDTAPGE